jgi:hypothetical protein
MASGLIYRAAGFVAVSALLVGSGCEGRTPDGGDHVNFPMVTAARAEKLKAAKPTFPDGVRYARTLGIPATMRPVALCELVGMFKGGAGLYQVEALHGATELTAEGVPDAFTYVQLRLVTSWGNGAPQAPIARIGGGPLPNGITKGWEVALTQGEIVGLLLEAPTKENGNYYHLHQLGVFREQDGGYTNGQLFTENKATRDRLGQLVSGLVGRQDCPFDEKPDYGRTGAHDRIPTVDQRVQPGQIILQEAPPTTGKPSDGLSSEQNRPSSAGAGKQ